MVNYQSGNIFWSSAPIGLRLNTIFVTATKSRIPFVPLSKVLSLWSTRILDLRAGDNTRLIEGCVRSGRVEHRTQISRAQSRNAALGSTRAKMSRFPSRYSSILFTVLGA